MNYLAGVKVISRKTVAAIITIFCVLLLSLPSCGRAMEGDIIALKFAPSSAGLSVLSSSAGFAEEDCIVLRCASFATNEHEIVAKISKSKDLKATTLVFVKPYQSKGTDANYILIAAAPIIGKEYEYDITLAKFYQVTPSSAEAAVNNYGISYTDWQIGASNSSEKFPCCE